MGSGLKRCGPDQPDPYRAIRSLHHSLKFVQKMIRLKGEPFFRQMGGSIARRRNEMMDRMHTLDSTATHGRHNLHKMPVFAGALLILFVAAAWLSMAYSTQAQAPSTKGDPLPSAPECDPNWLVVSSPNVGTDSNSLYGVDGAS